MSNSEQFHWKCQPQAEAFIEEALAQFCQNNEAIALLANTLEAQTSTRLFDWLDHIVLGYSNDRHCALEQAGFIPHHASSKSRLWHHPGAQLPLVILSDRACAEPSVAVRVESIADFLMVRGMREYIEGSPFSGYRRCCVSSHQGASLWVVERRGTLPLYPTFELDEYLSRYIAGQELWKSRDRDMPDEEGAMDLAVHYAEELIKSMGVNVAAWIVLEGERSYWQARNTAGQLQKNRQDRLGMGWANHDHHTFRSSRRHFCRLVRLFEMLGFHCRERFYAGKEAGWGAQVMENSACNLVLFLDVDLAPNEVEIDFSHKPLAELDKLGTIGLWCALHGDSILKAGMHHLEAQFSFDLLTKHLAHSGIRMMEPFSSFTYLKQAFTAGEIWLVAGARIDKLVHSGRISPEEAERFRTNGAVGSHLENLQRREGYKGFNQNNVSYIIKKTDPRNA